MTLLGWFHTVMGVIAILAAAYTLYQHRIIRAADKSGRAYLLITLFVAGSALAIYNQGGFGVGHILAVLTLTALLQVTYSRRWRHLVSGPCICRPGPTRLLCSFT